MASRNSVKPKSGCAKQLKTTNPSAGDGSTKISGDIKETKDGMIKEGHTSRVPRTGNNVNKQRKPTSPIQKSLPRSVQKSPVQRSRSPRQRRRGEKRRSDRTRYSIQSHIARISGGIRDITIDTTITKKENPKGRPQQKRSKSPKKRKQNTADKTQLVREQSKNRNEERNSQIPNRETQNSGDKIREFYKGKYVARRNLQPRHDDRKEENQVQKKEISLRDKLNTETSLHDEPTETSFHDEQKAKPDSPRSMTESEYCYSSDPDWGTSVWSESSSDDSQPGTVRTQHTAAAGDSDIDVREHALSQDGWSAQSTSSGSEDSPSVSSEIDSTDKSLSQIDIRDELNMRSPFRSARDQSSAESVSSISLQSSDSELVSKGDIAESRIDGPAKSLVRQKRSRQNKNAIMQSKKMSKDGSAKAKEKSPTGKCSKPREGSVTKRLSEVETRKNGIDTRRIQSESVVRAYRHRKQGSSPSQRIDNTAGRVQTRVRCEKRFVNVKGNEREFVKDKGKDGRPFDKEKESGFSNDRGTVKHGKSKGKDHKTEITPKTDKQRIHTKVSPKETKTFIERDDQSLDRKHKYETGSKDKYKPRVETKSYVKFDEPNEYGYKVYSKESIISNDEAMISDGYSASSSASSITSEVVSDTGGNDSEMDGNVGSTVSGRESKKCSVDKQRVKNRQKYGKDINKSETNRVGLSGSRLKNHQYGSQSKEMSDQPEISDIASREKYLKAKDGRTKEIQKTSSMKLGKCQSAKCNKTVADRVPPKLRMYITPVSSHPKSESELIKYVELQTKASVHKVNSLKPGVAGESQRTEIKSRKSGDKIVRATDEKLQMKTSITGRGSNTDSPTTKENQRIHRSKVSKDLVMKPATSESSGIKGKGGQITRASRQESKDYHKQRQMLQNRARMQTTF